MRTDRSVGADQLEAGDRVAFDGEANARVGVGLHHEQVGAEREQRRRDAAVAAIEELAVLDRDCARTESPGIGGRRPREPEGEKSRYFMPDPDVW